ncbi:MAG TPA: FHA domain-containing protein [Steroidobacteraceae bacterium]|nr:FHA domain-containing protein [Steroidobacteraceae bacterium]
MMSTRADRTQDKQHDTDSTEELPALDTGALEAGQRSEAGLSNTDTWVSPGPVSGSGGAPAGIFDTIRTLEANLHAKSEHTANLEQLLARAERERDSSERRLREREQGLARLERELEARAGALTQAERHRQEATEAQHGSERQTRSLEKEKTDLLSRMTDLEEVRVGLAADLEARGATIALFKGDLAARAEQIRSLERQRDALELEKVALADTLRSRDARLAFLDTEIAARNNQMTELEGVLAGRDENLAQVRATTEQTQGAVRALQESLAARDARIASLDTLLRDKEEARLELAQELQDQAHKVALAVETAHVSQRQAESCVEALQSLETRRNFYDDELFVREQEVERQRARVAGLEAGIKERAADMVAVQAQLRERDAVIVELQAEIATRDAALNERTSELGRLRAATHDSGGVIADLERRIKTHSSELARLQSELAARDARIQKGLDELRAAAVHGREHQQEQLALRNAGDSVRAQLTERAAEIAALAGALQAEQKRTAALEAELATRTRVIAEIEARGRMQAELAETHTRELDTWKEKWSTIVAAVSEKEARLAQMEADLRVKSAEVATRAERIGALQKTVDDQGETLGALEKELREKAESIARLEGDLRAAEDSMLRLESQLRQRSDQGSIAQRTLEEQRSQIRHLQDTLGTRDSAVARLEGELKASSEIIGNIQRDIRRLSIEAPLPSAPIAPPREQAGPPREHAEPASEPLTRLLVRLDGEAEIVHVINKKTTGIGRTDDNDIHIDTKYISRHHARILIAGNSTVVEDLGSTNGVFVNERRVNRRHALEDGDVLMVGKTQFRFAVKPA